MHKIVYRYNLLLLLDFVHLVTDILKLYFSGAGSAQRQPATRVPLQPDHTETPTHIEPEQHDQCSNLAEKVAGS